MSRNPYHRPPGSPRLQKSVVVFIDMLGTIDMTKEADKNKQSQILLEQLYAPLKKAQESLADKNIEMLVDRTQKDRFVLRGFSDNIVIGWPLSGSSISAAGSALHHALKKVSSFQLDMASRGFFFRGAITVGDIFIDEIAVFGCALVEAYKVERKLANTPRIILTDHANKIEFDYKDNYKPQEGYQLTDYLQCDEDGYRFVNYLLEGLCDPKLITKHKDLVIEKLNKFEGDTRIRKKYLWVARYHNDFCDKYKEEFSRLRIPLTDLVP